MSQLSDYEKYKASTAGFKPEEYAAKKVETSNTKKTLAAYN